MLYRNCHTIVGRGERVFEGTEAEHQTQLKVGVVVDSVSTQLSEDGHSVLGGTRGQRRRRESGLSERNPESWNNEKSTPIPEPVGRNAADLEPEGKKRATLRDSPYICLICAHNPTPARLEKKYGLCFESPRSFHQEQRYGRKELNYCTGISFKGKHLQ
ncbi:hypothetical protein IRJ41_022464, partial [Triplophysa rosa]